MNIEDNIIDLEKKLREKQEDRMLIISNCFVRAICENLITHSPRYVVLDRIYKNIERENMILTKELEKLIQLTFLMTYHKLIKYFKLLKVDLKLTHFQSLMTKKGDINIRLFRQAEDDFYASILVLNVGDSVLIFPDEYKHLTESQEIKLNKKEKANTKVPTSTVKNLVNEFVEDSLFLDGTIIHAIDSEQNETKFIHRDSYIDGGKCVMNAWYLTLNNELFNIEISDE